MKDAGVKVTFLIVLPDWHVRIKHTGMGDGKVSPVGDRDVGLQRAGHGGLLHDRGNVHRRRQIQASGWFVRPGLCRPGLHRRLRLLLLRGRRVHLT